MMQINNFVGDHAVFNETLSTAYFRDTLMKLNLRMVTFVSFKDYSKLKGIFPNRCVHRLELINCCLTADNINSLIELLPNIRQIKFTGPGHSISSGTLLAFCNWVYLSDLIIDCSNQISETNWDEISTLSNLKNLDLRNYWALSQTAMVNVVKGLSHTLERFCLESAGLSLPFFTNLARCKHLKVLKLCGGGMMDYDLHNFMVNMVKLEELGLQDMKLLFSKSFIPLFENWSFTQIKRLSVIGCGNLSNDIMLSVVRSCPDLIALILGKNNQIDVNGLQAMAGKCSKIRFLKLRGFNISSVDLFLLAQKLPGNLSFELSEGQEMEKGETIYVQTIRVRRTE